MAKERPFSFDRPSAQTIADNQRNHLPPDRSVSSSGTHAQGNNAYTTAPDVSWIRNDTGSVLVDQFQVLKIDGMVDDGFVANPSNIDRFKHEALLKGTTPDDAANAFAITLSAVGKADRVRCVTAGVVRCLVEVTDTGHQYCAPKPGSRTKLKSAAEGPALILGKSAPITGTNDRWCLIKIGAATPSSGGGHITAKLLQDLSTATLYVDGLIIAKRGTVPGTSEVGDTVRLYNTIQCFEGLTGDFCHALYRETVSSDYFEIFVKPCAANSLNDPSLDPDPEPGTGSSGGSGGGGGGPGGGLG